MKSDQRLTAHAQKRKQQRGIDTMKLELIKYFGTDHYQKGGCSLTYIDGKTIKQLRAAIDNLERVATIKTESPRVLRRLQPLRRWIHEKVNKVFPGSPRTCCSHGA
ncbi:MAG: hypothetical protein QE265_11355 [Rhodoferax sp.]|nr:hypothetical protein [Rhodoferax sp.]